jgi:hypothetical protein
MQATTPGPNRTGASSRQDQVHLMMDAVFDLSPQTPISTADMDEERQKYIVEADSVGSIPSPASLLKGAVSGTVAMVNGASPSLLLNKIGERIAFERSGTRLYDALIAKYLALQQVDEDPLGPFDEMPQDGSLHDGGVPVDGELALEGLRRIRAEEHRHFLRLCEAMTQLGGDPTAQTPCADVSATATMGVMQVLTDPRTTLAQCLDAMLIVELTDNASWELLCELAAKAGQRELSEQFLVALREEEQHLAMVRAWLRSLMFDAVGTHAV